MMFGFLRQRQPLRRTYFSLRVEDLAIYNAEIARGIVHTPEWDEQMQRLQEQFDAQALAQVKR